MTSRAPEPFAATNAIHFPSGENRGEPTDHSTLTRISVSWPEAIFSSATRFRGGVIRDNKSALPSGDQSAGRPPQSSQIFRGGPPVLGTKNTGRLASGTTVP